MLTKTPLITPISIARDMVALAMIEEHHTILEPSAGDGAICAAIREQHPTNLILAIEINAALAMQIADKGMENIIIYNADFFRNAPPKCQRIIAHPPIGGGIEFQHLQRMHDTIDPGGIIVALVSRTLSYIKFHQEKYGWLMSLEPISYIISPSQFSLDENDESRPGAIVVIKKFA